MKRYRIPCWRKLALVALLSITQVLTPNALPVAHAKKPADHTNPPIVLKKWTGRIDYAPDGTSRFYLWGTASHLGRFQAYCEVVFVPGDAPVSLAGEGVAAFRAANGDFLVGTVSTVADSDGLGSLTFHWKDSVQFSDGTTVNSSGRFAKAENRPPGLVVIAIIAVLAGLLLPVVQGCTVCGN